MALTRDQKTAQIQELVEKMKESQSVMFSHYIGMTVAESSELRHQLREAKAEMKVAKKTLIKIAAKEAGLPDVTDDAMEGPVSLIFSFEDPLSGAQIAFKFAKTHEQVALVGGIFEGKILSKREAMELAQMPSREVLLATFMSMVRSPLFSFASMCNSPMTGFARALSEIAKKGGVNPVAEAPAAEAPKEEAPAAEAPKEKPTEAAPAAEAAPETEAPAENKEGEAPTNA